MSAPDVTEQRFLAQRAAELWYQERPIPTFALRARYEWWRLATTPDDPLSDPVRPWTADEIGSIPLGTIDPRERLKR